MMQQSIALIKCNFGIAAVVGKKDIMEAIAGTWVAATFHGEVSLCAASLATIAVMEEKDGIAYLWRQGEKILSGYRDVVKRQSIEEYSRIQGPMPFFGLKTNGEEKMEKFLKLNHR